MKENIFSNFYTKVISFFSSNKNEGEGSRDTASSRLKLVLMQDRSNLDGATMQKMREQLISVISKYIEIDTEALDLNLEGDGDEIALMLNIPVIRARTKEEIEEMEKAEEEAKKAALEKEAEEVYEDAEEDSEESEDENESEPEEDEDIEDDQDDEDEDEEENIEDELITEEAAQLLKEEIVPSEENPFKEEKKKKN